MLVNTRTFTLACANVTWVAACSSGSDDEVHACDPLATTASSSTNQVEYDVAADDGRRIVVIAPKVPPSTGGYGERLFFGTAPTLTEVALTGAGHGKDICGDASFDFTVDGQSADASLWGQVNGPSCSATSRLLLGTTEIPLHQTGTKAAGLTYMCR